MPDQCNFSEPTTARYFTCILNAFGPARQVILLPGTVNHEQGFATLFKQNLRTWNAVEALYLRPPSQNLVLLNYYTNSLFS